MKAYRGSGRIASLILNLCAIYSAVIYRKRKTYLILNTKI